MSTTTETREVYCYRGPNGTDPHGIILTLDADDWNAWVRVREQEDDRLKQYAHGTPVPVTNQKDGERYMLRTAPCGLGCRCAAEATRIEDAGPLFVGHDCTLNDEPATIMGRLLDHGIVAHYPAGKRVNFAWPTIARIMLDNGGEFRS
jgi:hypothetical protein